MIQRAGEFSRGPSRVELHHQNGKFERIIKLVVFGHPQAETPSMAASSSSLTAVRSWRTAFLTLRDETLTSPPSIPQLVQSLIFSHSHSSLISAASDLPAHEVTSDLLFLIQLVANASQFQHDLVHTFSNTCRLIHDVSHRVSLDINTSSWALLLDSSTKIIDHFLAKATSSASLYKPTLECLETLRYLVSENQRKCSLPDDIQLERFFLSS